MEMDNQELHKLAQHCAEETQNYRNRQPHNPDYCFELMRRALEEQQEDSLIYVYNTYMPLARTWVHRHPSFKLTRETADFFASVALSNFYYAVRGAKFKDFDTLAKLLSYLKSCVNTAILQSTRNQPLMVSLQDDDRNQSKNIRLIKKIIDEELRDLLRSLFNNEKDLRLVEDYYIHRLKPRDIAKLSPELWENARRVSIDLQRIRRILFRNFKLRRYLGLSADMDAEDEGDIDVDAGGEGSEDDGDVNAEDESCTT